ncbi:sec-independent translocation protein mttA/Hcf106 [Coriobacterium glomerans PW2]|uniref:Sec-independent translocation protein mttA/Hcf106 n=1 Tax=Coriobacterium glomerans (strain ATCC 49209 / DSM 20642 / JCM 10262 / PW2) TaxID=700015 RepID=F2NAP2_CORGP|nr:twin-arginine translocase TatA/TatE family subunit [Coriobacterium glomerans]AEB07498.1 sec-independent translocation protein mttA/Hcf106 [Coriobacterium glomerans PW2]
MMPKGVFPWIVVLVIALLALGPKNLPKLGKSLGSTVKSIREGMEDDEETAEVEKTSNVPEDEEIRLLEAKLAAAKKKKEQAQEKEDAE